MILLAWNSFLDRWQVFIGAIVTVCLGVALVQSSLLTLVSAATADIPEGLSQADELTLQYAYEGVIVLLSMVLSLAIFVAIFIVSSTFSFAVNQRRQELALIQLTGASKGQVRSLLVGEAVLLGLVGSGLGVLLGLAVMRFQMWLLNELGFAPPGFETQWRWWVILVSLGVGVLIAVLGVLAASRRATQVRPLEALRDTGEASRVMTLSQWILGILFTVSGVVLFFIFPAGSAELPAWFIQITPFLVTIPLVIGFAALAPLVVPFVGRLFGLILRGPLGELALSNLRFDALRSASTAAPIMLLFAFVASIGGTMDSVSNAAQKETERTVQGDFIVITEQPAGSILAAVDGVKIVSEEANILFELRVENEYGDVWYESYNGRAVEASTFATTREIEATSGDLENLHGSAIAASPSVDLGRDWQVGDLMQIRIDGEMHEVLIVALLPGTISGPYFVLSSDLMPLGAGPWQHIVQIADDADRGLVEESLAQFGTVQTLDQWVADAAAAEERETFNILIVILGMTMLYTVIAMINAVVISASDRKREFAAARVTGLTRSQVVLVAFLESQAVVVIGVLLGGVAAAASVVGVSLAIQNLIGITVISIQWSLLAVLVLGASLVVAVTSIATTLTGTRTPPVRLVTSKE